MVKKNIILHYLQILNLFLMSHYIIYCTWYRYLLWPANALPTISDLHKHVVCIDPYYQITQLLLSASVV